MVLLAAGPAQACCVYNNATYPMETQSNIDGMHDWIVHPSNHRCTRGTGDKHVDFWMRGPFERAVISTQGRLWMAKHGWLTLSKKQDGKWKAQSYNPDGSVHSTTYIEERNDQPKKP